MKRLALALALLPIGAAAEQPLLLEVDQVILENGYAKAVISVKNNGKLKYTAIQVSCGFLKGGKAIESSGVILQNVPPGETAYETVLVRVSALPDEAKCRIAMTRP